jgi:Domain of unknown function (DUF4082)
VRIWPAAATPAAASVVDAAAVEPGVKFRTSTDGYVTGLRFFKGGRNTGTHVGHLWSPGGTLLASATFTGETAYGWQQVQFATAVGARANTTYVASYHTDTGFYAANTDYFATSGVTSGPLTALATGVDGPNGVYRYGASGFPRSATPSGTPPGATGTRCPRICGRSTAPPEAPAAAQPASTTRPRAWTPTPTTTSPSRSLGVRELRRGSLKISGVNLSFSRLAIRLMV